MRMTLCIICAPRIERARIVDITRMRGHVRAHMPNDISASHTLQPRCGKTRKVRPVRSYLEAMESAIVLTTVLFTLLLFCTWDVAYSSPLDSASAQEANSRLKATRTVHHLAWAANVSSIFPPRYDSCQKDCK